MLDDEFLTWLREVTERAWRAGAGSWVPGTRWVGGIDVVALERRLGTAFPEEHRRFLAKLHATWPRRRVIRYRGDTPVEVEVPGFYDWERDTDAIAEARAEVIDGLVFDVEHARLWPASWGPRPGEQEARAERVAALVATAPTLFPILDHRFVVAGTPGLVLSVHQSDIIVYGSDLREYLLNELSEVIGHGHRYEISACNADAIPFWGELIG